MLRHDERFGHMKNVGGKLPPVVSEKPDKKERVTDKRGCTVTLITELLWSAMYRHGVAAVKDSRRFLRRFCAG